LTWRVYTDIQETDLENHFDNIGNDLPLTYSTKKTLLLKSKIGIWDVAHKANRKGSLDQCTHRGKPTTWTLYLQTQEFKSYGFNGTNRNSFQQAFDRKSDLKIFSLPTHSPANTALT
jgi:G:T/U-mismatch repair DNA glycosylase